MNIIIKAISSLLLLMAVTSANEKIAENSVYQFKGEPIRDLASNKSYLTWLGKTGDIYGREYDHGNEIWWPALGEDPKIIQEFTRDPPDRHNYASVVVAPDGHLVVFQTDHLKKVMAMPLWYTSLPNPGPLKEPGQARSYGMASSNPLTPQCFVRVIHFMCLYVER